MVYQEHYLNYIKLRLSNIKYKLFYFLFNFSVAPLNSVGKIDCITYMCRSEEHGTFPIQIYFQKNTKGATDSAKTTKRSSVYIIKNQ